MITLLLILSYLAVFIFGAVCYAQFHAKAVATLQKGKVDAEFLSEAWRAEFNNLRDRMGIGNVKPPRTPPKLPDPPAPQ